jgi:glutamate racemase
MMAISRAYRIGVIDSGVGFCTVAKELKKRFQDKKVHFICIGDNVHFPYGTGKQYEKGNNIKAWSSRMMRYLVNQEKVDMLAIACHTASAYLQPVLPRIQNQLGRPIECVIGAGALEVVQDPTIKHVDILATKLTAKQQTYKTIINAYEYGRYEDKTVVTSTPCSKWVDFVQRSGANISPKSRKIVKEIMNKIAKKKTNKYPVDTVILGCTHFSFLKSTIIFMTGGKYRIIDPAEPFAALLYNSLKRKIRHGEPEFTYYFTKPLGTNVHHLAVDFLKDRIEYKILRFQDAASTWEKIVTDWNSWWKKTEKVEKFPPQEY